MKQTLAIIVALTLTAPAFGQEAVGIIIGPADTHGNLREIANLADPNASRILRWNDATNVIEWGVDATGGGGGSSEDLDLFAANPTNNAEFSPGTWRSQLSLVPDNDVQRYDIDLTSIAGGIVGIVKGLDDDGGFTPAVAGTDYVAPDADLTDLADGTLTGSKVSGAVTVAGGTVDNSVIGGTTPAAITGTTITATTNVVTVDDAYNATSWNGSTAVPTKNAVRDKIEAMSLGSGVATTDIDTSAELAAIVTDETGSGALVFGTSPTITTPTLNGTPTLGSASGWRSALSLTVGTNVQAYDIDLTSIAGGVVGLVKGLDDGNGYTAAVAGTDYVTPDADLTDLADGSLTGSKVSSATTSAVGVSELATSAETTTGSDTSRTITPDAYRGSDFGKRFGQFVCVGSATTLTTGDGKGEVFYRVPSELNGWNLVGVAAAVDTVSSSGTPTFQVRRRRLTSATATSDADMLSTAITIDASEFDSKDAATAAVINTSNDDVNTGDRIFADCDTAGTGTKGMSITLVFKKP